MRGQKFGVTAISIIVAFLSTAHFAHASSCGRQSVTATGNYFIAYEASDYSPEGYLVERFRNASTTASIVTLGTFFYDDACTSVPTIGNTWLGYYGYPTITIPDGVTDWSVHFTSIDHFDVWDDNHGVILMSADTPVIFPEYTSVSFAASLSIYNNNDMLFSSGHKIKNDAPSPIVENKLDPSISPCDPMTGSGYFFDPSYERAEYINGLLQVHVRFSVLGPHDFYANVFPYQPSSVSCGYATVSAETTGPYTVPETSFSSYMRYFSLRMASSTHWEFWNDETNAKITCAHCEGDIPADSPYVFLYAQYANRDSEIRTTMYPPTEPTTTLTPVIIIPGILGSARDFNGQWVIDPILHTFDNLIATLAANGYVQDKTLFTFPYDWHLANEDTAVLLKQKIDAVKIICGCDKVDLVAHSMGGLVARQYIQSSVYEHDVRKLIFLGTPQLGAPKTYLMWEGGEADTTPDDQKLKTFLLIEALKRKYTNLFDYEHKFPIVSIQELLPVYGYIKHAGSQDVAPYPNSQWYPNNTFLFNLNSNIGNLYNSGVSISNFVGQLSASTTIETIRVIPPTLASATSIWGFGFPDGFTDNNGDHGLERGPGDGVVPISSASFVNQNLQILDSDHGSLPTKAEAGVYKELTGNEAKSLANKDHGVSNIMLLVQIMSPADILIIAPDGKRVGKDFSSGQEINEIPDAFYSGFQNDNEFVTIPAPLSGQYKIITQGTGNGGEYTLATAIIGDSTSTETFFSGQTLPNLITEHDVSVDTANPDEIKIFPADQMPPTISIIQPATTTYTHSDFMPAKVIFTDDTGVATTSVTFDATSISASSTIDLFFQLLGAHALKASATDLVNNATSTSISIKVIATYDSTVSDVNRAFSLGWILKKNVRDDLLAKLGRAVTIGKKIDTIVISTKPRVEKKVERLEQRIDQVLLHALVRDVQQAHDKGKINDQAYQLLTADLNWLIDHN